MSEQQENLEQIKQEDRKSFSKYIIILVVSGIFGGIIGVATVFLEASLQELPEVLHYLLVLSSPYIMIIVPVLCAIIVIILYRKARKQYNQWDGDNEDTITDIEKKISIAMLVITVNTIITFVFFVVGISSVIGSHASGESSVASLILPWVGYLISLVFIVAAQQKLVNFSKEINPEKRGSVYDIKFQKKWEESCDEAEKLVIYKSAYASYKAVNKTCLILWVVCMIGNLVWDFGFVPVFVIGAIWMVSAISYAKKAIDLSK